MPTDGSRLPDLNHACLVHILRHCDEPTRDIAMRASHEMKAMTDMARRLDYTEAAKRHGRWTKEILPTATELADRGCPKPNWKHIAKTMQTSADGALEQATKGPLARFYELAIGLSDAQKAGLAFTLNFVASCYVGGGSDDTPEGFGINTWADGHRYEGGFKAGLREGHGVSWGIKGNCYEEQWKAGMRHGHGVTTLANGYSYEGHYKANHRHGYGVCTLVDAERYWGLWEEGNRHGHGVITWADGRCYKGQWKANMRHGHGVQTWPDGWRYERQWKEDMRHGHGVQTWPDGRRYEGQWKADMEFDAVTVHALPARVKKALISRFCFLPGSK